MTRPRLFRSLSAAAVLAAPAWAAADWKPAPAPLMTRWGKEVTPDTCWREYPRPQLVRKDWQCLNGLWDYAVTPRGAPAPDKWDGRILVPFAIESALSGVGKHVGKDQHLWYRRRVECPADWKGRRVLLRFEAVDFEAAVFVNGKEVGTHKGMSDPFAFDVTDHLNEGKAEVVVRVWDPTDDGAQPRGKQVTKPGGIWYTPVTGIWQTVWMEPVPDAHIQTVRFTPDVDAGEVEVVAQATGGAAVTVAGPGVRGTGRPGQPFRVKVPDPKLWAPDSPHLYEVTVGLLAGREGDTDSVGSYFAMRKIGVGKAPDGHLRLMLNNKPLFQLGPLDQGWWPDGLLTPPSDAALRYDVEVLKKLGMNMLRKHIKVEPARFYRHCDELGMLVWQDMPSMGQPKRGQFISPKAAKDATFTPDEKQQYRTELKAMIDHLRGFGCVVAWVPFNEGWGQHDTNDILKWVKEYDPSRLVNGPSGWTDRGYGDMKDLHDYPGPGMFPVLPDRASVLGEFGGLGLPLPGHLWKGTDNWGYRTYRTTEDLRNAYRRLLLRLHPLVEKGLAAAVYTQTTDVEVEVNGLMTYDREVLKFDPADTARWHQALFGKAPRYKDLVPTSEVSPQTWRYTFAEPPADWLKPEFDAGGWKEGPGGFGAKGTPGAVVGTEWKTKDVWLRKTFDLVQPPAGEVLLRLHHDDDADVYLNGVLAARVFDHVTAYGEVPVTAAARKTLKTGPNTIAVRCKQNRGGQYVDCGLVEVVTGVDPGAAGR